MWYNRSARKKQVNEKKACTLEDVMYKFDHEKQISFTDFNQPQGLQMNPNNRWVRKASMIPWKTIELQYAELFSKEKGNVARPLRMALGSLLIQKQYQFSDEELVEQIRENPYY